MRCFAFAGKMSNMRLDMLSLLLKANKKVYGQGSGDRKRDARRERTAEAWLPVKVTDDPIEEEEVP